MLEYKSKYVYLGGIITDAGNITADVEKYVCEKRSNVTIKFNNFLRVNYLAPLPIKLMILDACVSSSLTYGCESWGTSSIKSIEIAYRLGLKRALSIRENCNTEIVYIESGRYPLSIRISKQQLKFWINLQTYLDHEPNHPLNNLIEQGLELDIPFLKHYIKLKNDYGTPETCETVLKQRFYNDTADMIRTKANGDDISRLGTYIKVNPQLKQPDQLINSKILEFERILITRYRTGCHNLRIESGRHCNPPLPREERLCQCNEGVQTLHHCLFDCPLLIETQRAFNYSTVEEALNLNDAAKLLLQIEKILQIRSH